MTFFSTAVKKKKHVGHLKIGIFFSPVNRVFYIEHTVDFYLFIRVFSYIVLRTVNDYSVCHNVGDVVPAASPTFRRTHVHTPYYAFHVTSVFRMSHVTRVSSAH